MSKKIARTCHELYQALHDDYTAAKARITKLEAERNALRADMQQIADIMHYEPPYPVAIRPGCRTVIYAVSHRMQDLATANALLLECEWNGDKRAKICPYCGGVNGHTPDCRLDTFLHPKGASNE